jgi:hypothetical protein
MNQPGECINAAPATIVLLKLNVPEVNFGRLRSAHVYGSRDRKLRDYCLQKKE